MSTSPSTTVFINALVQSTGASDATSAIRVKAADAIDRYCAEFGEPAIPLNVEALASFLGISISADPPVHSKDAELVPKIGGRVEIRVRADRPDTRKRFSVAHEISHTFFPDYEIKTWCRPDSRHRRRSDPDDFIEMLCDVGAALLLMPDPWFVTDAARVTSASGLVHLALKYGVSREAALRRFADSNPSCVAAIFLSWKLKPTQHITIGQRDQQRLFGDPADEVMRAKKLRVDYSIPSREFTLTSRYIPGIRPASCGN